MMKTAISIYVDSDCSRDYCFWWNNFTNAIPCDRNYNRQTWLLERDLMLAEYNAAMRCVESPFNIYVEFESEEIATMFLLRWS